MTDGARGNLEEVIISADSHVVEPPELWATRLPAAYRDRAPGAKAAPRDTEEWPEGAWNPVARLKDMAVDDVSGEVLYPTVGLRHYQEQDAGFQEACFQVYNDWLTEYCTAAPDRLWGVAMISAYNIDHAVRELERAKKAGLRGALIWQYPPNDALSFFSDHYERFWGAAQDLGMPINLHIVTGPSARRRPPVMTAIQRSRASVNENTFEACESLFDLIFSGVLERFPRLKFVIVENDIGWLPFWLFKADKSFGSRGKDLPIKMLPSEYFNRQVYATFLNDPVGAFFLSRGKVDNFMWSSDYPHGITTWPNSRKVIAEDLGHLTAEDRLKVTQTNVAGLYDLPVPSPLGVAV